MELRPHKGGFYKPLGCGSFVFAYLSGHGPYGSPRIKSSIGAPQAEVFFQYKNALIREIAMARAIRLEEKLAKREDHAINPKNIEKLYDRILEQTPYKTTGCRYHSFVVYFSNLIRLNWVEFTGQVEHSEFQDHYPKAQSRKYYRLTAAGMAASAKGWANPQLALYGY